MEKITLYYNARCSDCVRQAKRTAQLDWLDRVEILTEDFPLGKVPIGEIVVVEKQSRQVFTGIYATRKVCLQVPLFFLYGVLLHVLILRKVAGREKQGCNGDACEI